MAFAERMSIARRPCVGPVRLVHLNISRVMMAAGGILVVPAKIEADVLGDDHAFAARHVVVGVARVVGALFANERRRMMAEKEFDGDETAADHEQIGFDDTRIRSANAETPSGVIAGLTSTSPG
jgi:hypothetical protein